MELDENIMEEIRQMVEFQQQTLQELKVMNQNNEAARLQDRQTITTDPAFAQNPTMMDAGMGPSNAGGVGYDGNGSNISNGPAVAGVGMMPYAGYTPGVNTMMDPTMGGMNREFSQYTQSMRDDAKARLSSTRDNVWSIMTMDKSRISIEDQRMRRANFRQNLANGTMSGIGAGVGMLAEGAGWALLPGMAGAIGGAGIGFAAKVVTDQFVREFQQGAEYNKYLMQNSYQMISPKEGGRAGGGFTQQDQKQVAKYLAGADSKFNIEAEELQGLLANFTESGAMRSVSDINSFKTKMDSMIETAKTSALLLSDTIDNVGQMMGELERAGIGAENTGQLAGMSKWVGTMNGISASEVMGGMVDFAATTSTPVSNRMTAAIGVAAGTSYYANLRDNLAMFNGVDGATGKQMLYNNIMNQGGPVAAAQNSMSAVTGVLSTNQVARNLFAKASVVDENGVLTFDPALVSRIREDIGQRGVTVVSNEGARYLNANPDLAAVFTNQAGVTDAISMLSVGEQNEYTSAVFQSLKEKYGGADAADSTAKAFAAMGLSNMSPVEQASFLDYVDKVGVEAEYAVKAQGAVMEMAGKMQAGNYGNIEKIGNWFEKTGDWMGQGGAAMSAWVTNTRGLFDNGDITTAATMQNLSKEEVADLMAGMSEFAETEEFAASGVNDKRWFKSGNGGWIVATGSEVIDYITTGKDTSDEGVVAGLKLGNVTDKYMDRVATLNNKIGNLEDKDRKLTDNEKARLSRLKDERAATMVLAEDLALYREDTSQQMFTSSAILSGFAEVASDGTNTAIAKIAEAWKEDTEEVISGNVSLQRTRTLRDTTDIKDVISIMKDSTRGGMNDNLMGSATDVWKMLTDEANSMSSAILQYRDEAGITAGASTITDDQLTKVMELYSEQKYDTEEALSGLSGALQSHEDQMTAVAGMLEREAATLKEITDKWWSWGV